MCQHNTMIANDSPTHTWKCADCGYVYGLSDPGAAIEALRDDLRKISREANLKTAFAENNIPWPTKD